MNSGMPTTSRFGDPIHLGRPTNSHRGGRRLALFPARPVEAARRVARRCAAWLSVAFVGLRCPISQTVRCSHGFLYHEVLASEFAQAASGSSKAPKHVFRRSPIVRSILVLTIDSLLGAKRVNEIDSRYSYRFGPRRDIYRVMVFFS